MILKPKKIQKNDEKIVKNRAECQFFYFCTGSFGKKFFSEVKKIEKKCEKIKKQMQKVRKSTF